MGTGGSFLLKGREADHFLQLVPRPRKVELYLHSPICLDGVVLN
jgi:hypothetical protein